MEGLKLAYIGDDAIYLLYPGRWFPVTNYGIDRFTAAINVTAPTGITVVGSGGTGVANPLRAGKTVTLIVAESPLSGNDRGRQLSGNLSRQHQSLFRRQQKTVCRTYGDTANKELEYFHVDLRSRYQSAAR